MEHNNRETLNHENEANTTDESIENSENVDNELDSQEETVDIYSRIESKIVDLRELQHETNPHRKFDLIESWMGGVEDFAIYDQATPEQLNQIIELMENLKPFADEYSNVLHTERNKIRKVSTYLK